MVKDYNIKPIFFDWQTACWLSLDALVSGQVLTCSWLFNHIMFIEIRLLGISYKFKQYQLHIRPNTYLLKLNWTLLRWSFVWGEARHKKVIYFDNLWHRRKFKKTNQAQHFQLKFSCVLNYTAKIHSLSICIWFIIALIFNVLKHYLLKLLKSNKCLHRPN